MAGLAWHLAAPLAYLVMMLAFFPSWNEFWLVLDEGYNLIKAMDVARGYALYSQVWSDQAPLLTYLLAGLFRLYGASVNLSRFLILGISCLLVWAVFQYLRLAWGKIHAITGAFILVLLPNFPLVSAAVLVGQPSLTFAMLSMLALAGWHLRRRQTLLILSAAMMSLSLLFKLFTGYLVPIFLVILLVSEYARGGRKIGWGKVVRPAILWGFTLAALTVGLGLLMVKPADVAQLIQPNISATQAANYTQNSQVFSINYYLLPAWPVLLAALVGILAAWKKQCWLAAYPLAWMASSYLILLVYHPIWWHHQFLVTLPAAILAAGGIGESLVLLVNAIRNPPSFKKSWPLLTAGFLSLVLVCAVRLPQVDFITQDKASNPEAPHPPETKFMNKITQFAPQTNWMITDMPMFAFRAGLPVPPELAVISWKRRAAGDLTEEDILAALRRYQPEQVLFGRFTFPTVFQYLEENYRLVQRRDTMMLYVRKDLTK